MLPLFSIIRKHSINFHCYADDTQFHLSIEPNHTDCQDPTKPGICLLKLKVDVWRSVLRTSAKSLKWGTSCHKVMQKDESINLISSILDFCNSLWSHKSENAAARVLSRTRKRHHISPVLASLHWLPIKFRVDFKTLLPICKAVHGLGPFSLIELLTPCHLTRVLHSQNTGLLVVPMVSISSIGGRAFMSLNAHVTAGASVVILALPILDWDYLDSKD